MLVASRPPAPMPYFAEFVFATANHYYIATFKPTLADNFHVVVYRAIDLKVRQRVSSIHVQTCTAEMAWTAIRTVLQHPEILENVPRNPSTPVSTPVNPGEAETPEAPRG